MIRYSKRSGLQAFVLWVGRRKPGPPNQAWFSALLLITLTSCAARSRPQAVLPTVNIPVECASSIHLLNCDLSSNPLRCRTVAVNYRKGCEQVMVSQ